MNAMYRRIVWVAAIFGIAGLFNPPAAHAAPVGAACLAPINSGDDDPQPRDIHFLIAPDKKTVTVTACVVSNAVQYAELSIAVSVFDSAGRYLNRASEGLGGVRQTAGTGPNSPKIVATVAIDVSIDPKSADQLLQQALIGLDWMPCNSIADGRCDPGDNAGASFLRDVTAPAIGHALPYPDIPDGKGKR